MQALDVTGDQQAAQVMEHLLGEMYGSYRGPVKTGPGDRGRIKELVKSVPAVGGLLATYVKEDSRPGWQRFLDFATTLGEAAVKTHGAATRLIIVIDPRPALKLAAPGDWIPLGEDLPEAVRLIIAQRPDDTLVTDGDARRVFSRILESPLGDLSEREVAQWYKQEIDEGLLKEFDTGLHQTNWRTAYQRYAGYPLAHDAVIKVLAHDKPEPSTLQDAITCLPQKVEGLLDLLYGKLCNLGDDAQRAALTLCVFGLPTPREVWARASGKDPVAFSRLLGDHRFACLFRRLDTQFGECFLPYHQLFTERLERELEQDDLRKHIAEAAWSAIAPELSDEALKTCNAPFFALTAVVPVAMRSSDAWRLLEIIETTFPLKLLFGLLDEAAFDMHLQLVGFGSDERIAAAAYSNLGIIMRTRGDLDGAEQMYRKSV
ncbi:MAG: hypothetical protein L0H73_09315 [Nitrococcus sp.]|nr:hypothetical protein [Nitrococcus sp.]